MNEKVAGAEKHATEEEKQMQKAEKNSYHRNWETNAESRKKQLPWELGNKCGKQKKQLPWELGNKYGEH